MALMMSALYDALRQGGTPEEPARKAAEEVADDTKQISDVRSDLAVVKAMLAAVLAGVAGLVIKTFFG